MKYVADDGMEFDNEKECLEYETLHRKIMQSFILLDKSFKEIDVTSLFYLEDVQYLWIPDNCNIEDILLYLDDQYGLADGITDCGMYTMKEEELVWDSIDKLIAQHENELSQLNKAKRRIIEKYNI